MIKLIFITLIILITSILILPIYRINLSVQINNTFKVMYLNGAFWLNKNSRIDQYRNRPDTFSLDYFTSVFQPLVKIDGKISSVYRMSPEKINIAGIEYYYYVDEDGVFLADDAKKIPLYNKNLITSKTKSTYAGKYSLLNTEFSDIINSYIYNKIDMSLNCDLNEDTANCAEKLDKLDFIISKGSGAENSFYYNNTFRFNQKVENSLKEVYVGFVAPPEFEICFNSLKSDCINTDTKSFVYQPDFPVRIYTKNDFTIKKLKDMRLTDFEKNTMFLPGKLSTDSPDMQPMKKSSIYILHHKLSNVQIEIKPKDNQELTPYYMEKFRTILFNKQNCELNCKLEFEVTVK